MLDYNIRMQIAEKGWYLLSVPSKMTWSDAVTYWNMQDCDIYEYIHELKTEPVLHGNNVEREDWEKIHIQSNIILLPQRHYLILHKRAKGPDRTVNILYYELFQRITFYTTYYFPLCPLK